jgi:hypothetical protein
LLLLDPKPNPAHTAIDHSCIPLPPPPSPARPAGAMDPFHHLNASFSNPYHPLLSPSPPHHFYPLPPPLAAEPPSSSSLERLPQWSHAETAAFLAIRAELDHSFLTTKRNKALWEAVSSRLAAQGFARTPDQCKSKWKNLVTRFKGTEADPPAATAAARQFPFHDEMRRIFDARAERARALVDERNDKAKGKLVRPEDDGAGEEEDDNDDDEKEVEASETVGEEERGAAGAARKRRRKQGARTTVSVRSPPDQGEVEAMLREFMRRQVEMEERWVEAAEAREAERRAREAEWRTAMVALGEERLALVRRWRDREDAWRARAEEREERRHRLVAALLAKLGADAS